MFVNALRVHLIQLSIISHTRLEQGCSMIPVTQYYPAMEAIKTTKIGASGTGNEF